VAGGGTLRRVTSDDTPQYLTRPASSRWHDGVTVGDRYPADMVVAHPLVPLEEIRMEPLAPMLVPEEPRSGVLDPSECWHCPARGRDHWIWPRTDAGLLADNNRQVAATLAHASGEALV
jgi:hypothetical protein